MKIVLSIILLVFTCLGYDEQLLDAQAQILPKIALLDKDLDKKAINGKIVIVIAHDADDTESAKNLASTIMSKSGGHIGSKPLRITTSSFASLDKQDMSMIFIMDSSEANIKKAAQVAKNKNLVSFAYSRDALTLGAVLSLQIERTSIITLNRTAMRNNGVSFIESFYKIVKIMD